MTHLRRLENAEVTPGIAKHAQAILNAHRTAPFGSQFPFESDGAPFVGVIEKHYHPPGGSLRPWGDHPGCSVFAVEPDAADSAEPKPQIVAPFQKFRFGANSLRLLSTVDPRLQATMRRAIELTPVDFSIVCGRRSKEEQRRLFVAGKTPTMNSRHLTGHAVDVAPFVKGQIVWDWPHYHQLAPAIKAAAKEVGCPLEWGGDWTKPNTPDGPHFQIPWGK